MSVGTDEAPFGFYEFAAADPDALAVVDVDGKPTTRGELLARVNRLSNALAAAGVGIDDRVAHLCHNSVSYVEWALATAQIGGHLVPLNFHSVAEELAYIVDNSGSKVVGVSAELSELGAASLDQAGFAGTRVSWPSAPGFRSLVQFTAGASSDPPPVRTYGGPMLYTAGTTGRPKGVLWPAWPGLSPETALRATAPMFVRRGMSVGGTSLVCGPLYHGAPGAQALLGLHFGQSVILLDRWDSERVLALIDEHGVTHAQMAPIHFHRLLQLPEATRTRYDVSSLRAVTHAGSGCPVPIKQAMMDWFGPVLYEYYAASEGYATSISPADWLEHPGSVGHVASDGAEIIIVDDADGSELEPGQIGTVFVRLPGAPESEYLGDPAKTAESRREGGYRTFGDMGYVDPDGWMFLVDRRSDMILSGAVNIYPAEVEEALKRHPEVSDAAVIGVPDDEWGQRVMAFVVPEPGLEPSAQLEQGLRNHCEQLIARFKCPRDYEFRAELPYSEAGKLLRRELREPYWT
jgi:long-chain acyl-CoA synthetase